MCFHGAMSVSDLPTGTVTFLFTDIEGSTNLLRRLGTQRYGRELSAHHDVVRGSIAAHGGVEVGTEGDAFFVVFTDASEAVSAAAEIQRRLDGSSVRIRMGLHSGTATLLDGEYVGLDIHKAARVSAAAHGGQVLVTSATRSLSEAPARDLGEHRLKDFPTPERLFQIGPGDFPPLRAPKLTNLPLAGDPIIGRDDDLAALAELIGEHRLVTITGPGGIGKTRVAMALAEQLRDRFTDGVWWVDLEAARSADAVLATIAETIGTPEAVSDYLSARNALVILDNFEQVIDAAPTLGPLADTAPSLRLLVTSRERLAIRIEREYPLSSLSDESAAALFRARASRVSPGFRMDDPAAQICRRLDNLPLAIELAATRVRMLTTQQILDRLQDVNLLTSRSRDAPDRRKRMHATIAWSYDLLIRDEQRCFRGLGVFPSSFDLDAAEEVALADLDLLTSLVDKSLVATSEGGRFTLLSTTRDFAARIAAESGEEAALRERHARCFIDRVRGSAHLPATALTADVDNLRLALEWTLDHDVEAGFEIAAVLGDLAHTRGGWLPIFSWYEAAIDTHASMERRRRHATAAFYSEAFARAEEISARALDEARDSEDKEVAELLVLLGMSRWARGAREEAAAAYRKALGLYESRNDTASIASTLHLLAETLRDAGDRPAARELLERAITLKRDAQAVDSQMRSIHSLADLELDDGNLIVAARHYAEALTMAREVEDDFAVPYCLAGLACVAAGIGEIAMAGRLWSAAEGAETDAGVRMLTPERARYESIIRAHVSDARFEHGRGHPDRRAAEAILDDLVRATTDEGPVPASH